MSKYINTENSWYEYYNYDSREWLLYDSDSLPDGGYYVRKAVRIIDNEIGYYPLSFPLIIARQGTR
jgi:hypothetical protein